MGCVWHPAPSTVSGDPEGCRWPDERNALTEPRGRDVSHGAAEPTMDQMTPTKLREIISRLGWSQNDLARISGRDEARVRKMARGAQPIDEIMRDFLVRLEAFSASCPVNIDNNLGSWLYQFLTNKRRPNPETTEANQPMKKKDRSFIEGFSR